MVLIEFIKGFVLTVAAMIASVVLTFAYGYGSAFLLSYTDLSHPVKMMIGLLGLAGIIGGIASAVDKRGTK